MENYHLVVSDGGYKNGLAYGSFRIFDSKGLTITHNQFIIGIGTNNQAEYIALLNALAWCLDNNIKRIVCLTDSKLVVKQVTGEWKKINRRMRQLCKKVKEKAKQFESFEIRHISEKYIKQKLGH